MSPSGRSKLAIPRFRKFRETSPAVVLAYLLLWLSASCSCEDPTIVRTTPTTVYEGDYYENGVAENGFDRDNVVVSAHEEVQEKTVGATPPSDMRKVTKDSRGEEFGAGRTYCFGFESKCKCSPDGSELTCKAAGFVQVPSNLHSTLKKM